MPAIITGGDLWGAVITVAASILSGAVLMGWRLGRLEGTVTGTLADHERRITDLEADRRRRGP